MLAVEKQPISKYRVAKPADGFDIDDPLGNYLRELQHLPPLLTREEEQQLATRMDKGKAARQRLAQQGVRLSPETKTGLMTIITEGKDAENTLIERNQRLVVCNAMRYQGRGLELLDLIQEGNIGLTRAAKKFEIQRGNKFSTIATWWICQAMERAVSDKGSTIRRPVHAADITRKIMGISKRLTQELGREPTPGEIADEYPNPKMNAEKIKFYLEKSMPSISLQHLIGENNDEELGHVLAIDPEPSPPEQSTHHLLQRDLAFALASLDPRDAKILRLRFGLDDGSPLTLEETGKKMGVTRERIRQVQARALKQLKLNPTIHNQLNDYLDTDTDR